MPKGVEVQVLSCAHIYPIQSKTLVYIGLFVGSTIGGIIPELWGADMFSISSMVFSAVGAIIGIYIGFKLSQEY